MHRPTAFTFRARYAAVTEVASGNLLLELGYILSAAAVRSPKTRHINKDAINDTTTNRYYCVIKDLKEICIFLNIDLVNFPNLKGREWKL
jgi:hypothetical protein